MTDCIRITGARLHNLKNISLEIPRNKLVVLTGLSGSGKSTLGFDILFKEGQRQYLETLGFIPLGMAKPPVDAISGLSPAISIDQHLANRSPRSTVGTSTEIYTYLRLLFARLGHRPCPSCGEDVPPSSQVEGDWENIPQEDEDSEETFFPCPHCGAAIPEMSMGWFSFNKPAGACPTCTGLGVVRQVDLSGLVDEEKSIPEGAVRGWNSLQFEYYLSILKAAAKHYGFELDPALPLKAFTPVQRDLLFHGVESPEFRRHFPSIEPPRTVRGGRFEGIATSLLRRHAEHIGAHVNEADYEDKLDEFLITSACPDCGGTRLRLESRQVSVHGFGIVELARLPLEELADWIENLEAELSPEEKNLADLILESLTEGIRRVVDVGAGYLSLERSSPSLSAGESQRLRLASLLGSSLSGVLYVFDEPTIGLHPRDTGRLIRVLRQLRDLGNTVLVIEHDLEMIAAADTVVDFGPGAGKDGGQIVAQGTPEQIAANLDSLTGAYLSGRLSLPTPAARRPVTEKCLVIHGARANNLQDITVRLPLGLLLAVTGVSGSGKSSLVFDILDRALRRKLYGSTEIVGEHDSIEGTEALSRVVTIDQEHIGRIPRSNVATYADIFMPIREAFARASEAEERGFTARTFSFNAPGGRCERCQGTGMLSVQMHFMPEVEVRCPACHGKRFKAETLEVRYKGLDISQVLELTVDEALGLFADLPAARSRLQVLADVGLGYLQLGQPAPTLSGGESQRVKLSKELGRRGSSGCLYLLDEPTTGLHLADTARLLALLQRLVEVGNSVIFIEHNLEMVKAADWVIDLGPEGGKAGGRIVAEGTPEQVAEVRESYTGQGLRKIL